MLNITNGKVKKTINFSRTLSLLVTIVFRKCVVQNTIFELNHIKIILLADLLYAGCVSRKKRE